MRNQILPWKFSIGYINRKRSENCKVCFKKWCHCGKAGGVRCNYSLPKTTEPDLVNLGFSLLVRSQPLVICLSNQTLGFQKNMSQKGYVHRSINLDQKKNQNTSSLFNFNLFPSMLLWFLGTSCSLQPNLK